MMTIHQSKSFVFLFWAGFFWASSAQTATITKNFTFSNGGTASASAVNSDFDQLFTEINAKETRITTLEGASSTWLLNGTSAYYNGGNVGIGSSSPAAKLEVTGAFRLSSVTTDTYTTPVGSSVPTKINIPFYDPGNFGQVVAMGVPVTANTTSRVLSLFDARNVPHQPTVAVFSPDENNFIGFSWNGSNSVSHVASTGDVGIIAGNSATDNVRITSAGNVGIGSTAPGSVLDMATTWNNGAVDFTGIKLNVTDTASGGGSKLLDLQRNGTSQFFVATGSGGTYAKVLGASTLTPRMQVALTTDSYARINFGLDTSDNALLSMGPGGGTQRDTQFSRLAAGTIAIGANVGDTAGTNGTLVAGSIGIGTTNPGYQLQLSTDSAAKPGTATWTIPSDERLKDIRAPFSRSLDAIEGIQPIYFRYKKSNPLGLPSDKEYVGVKAQDVARTVPEAVQADVHGYLHVTSDAILWTMLNAIKESYHLWRSDAAEVHRELASLRAENAALRVYLCAKDPQASICR